LPEFQTARCPPRFGLRRQPIRLGRHELAREAGRLVRFPAGEPANDVTD
jgi:hypothetical protein